MKFQNIIWDYYKKHKRKLLWREEITPYNIFVSEIMLQQTQVSRVEKKFPKFIKKFPDFSSLAEASTKDVLTAWQGMGYNRRALYLKKATETIIKKYNGYLPNDLHILGTLPGIGKTTASSITTFVWNQPTVFIETNIRRVFIHFFFSERKNIDDKDIIPLVEKTLDKRNPREWYYALMDYGSHLPKITKNPNRKSKHYAKQSQFKGSDREIRGKIIRSILKRSLTIDELETIIQFDKKRLYVNLLELKKEGFVMEKKGKYSIK
ncbi:A/G-specific adenine glycosylase [Candidatus Roizmanbacteria bacterium]|nr:A/G-specific adenine glycosylase [Candidatus Roizmanbacteria bacterium]